MVDLAVIPGGWIGHESFPICWSRGHSACEKQCD
jgi:hypothetical protein